MLQKIVPGWAWILVIYGPAYILFLNKVTLTMPGAGDLALFSQPGGGGMLILSLLALERGPFRYWLAMLLAAIMMLAVQVRAEWLGVSLGLSALGYARTKDDQGFIHLRLGGGLAYHRWRRRCEFAEFGGTGRPHLDARDRS